MTLESSATFKDDPEKKADDITRSNTVVEEKATSDSLSFNSDDVNIHQTQGDIIYRSLSWQKCAGLLFGEYVCLAILSFPWAYSVLGLAGGIITTMILGIAAYYTGIILWKFCMLNPNLLNICDIGYKIFGNSKTAYIITIITLVVNNIFIQGLHTLTGATILNTLSEHGTCTLVFSIIICVVCLVLTLPRKLDQIATMGIVSAVCMGVALLLGMIFHGIQGREGTIYKGEDHLDIKITAFAPKGTTFVDGFNAFLNITFTFIGHICYPTFIAEMKHPEEFPKALMAVTVMEIVVFNVVGIVIYYYVGPYATTPAVGNLKPVFKKIAFAFVLPPTIIIGVIYGSVVAKFIFGRIFIGTKHYNHHTTVGWVSWVAIVSGTWFAGWAIGEAIPFFSALLSLMSALFDSYIGYFFWPFAWYDIKKTMKEPIWRGQSWWRKGETLFQPILLITGVFLFGPGTYASVQGIIDSYHTGSIKSPFTCADNSM